MVQKSMSLQLNPRLSNWLGILPDGRFELKVGKVEIGQGILTALKQIALAELCVSAHELVLGVQSTDTAPNEGLTAGSMSIVDSGCCVRLACAQLRQMYVALAAKRCARPLGELRVVKGTIVDQEGVVLACYSELHAGIDFDAEIESEVDSAALLSLAPGPRPRDLIRIDLPAKVRGEACFIQDLDFPNVLHARVLRPSAHHVRLGSMAPSVLAGIREEVQVFREGSFIALLGEREEEVYLEASRIGPLLTWEFQSEMPPAGQPLSAWLKQQPSEPSVVAQVAPAMPVQGAEFNAQYSRAFIAHASIAPSCGVAQFSAGQLRVWTHSQSIFHLRSAIAATLELDVDAVVVTHVQSAGCYGHNGADDAAFDAALLAVNHPDRAVRVLWSRPDELGSAPVGPAAAAHLSAWLKEDGFIGDWNYEVWSNGCLGRPGYSGTPAFLGDAHRRASLPMPPSADPVARAGYGIARNAMPAYRLDGVQVRQNRLLAMPIRTSALRCLGAHFNVFAIESFMDELAAACDSDPIAFRLKHLEDERAREVLHRVSALASWPTLQRTEGVGYGVGFARYKNSSAYCAVIAQVEAAHCLKVRKLFIAVDAGRIVNTDGLLNQIEGGAIQAVSWTLMEEVRFDASQLTSLDWEQYPILRFPEVPHIEIALVERPDQPSLGVGECAHGPVAGAISNALCSALGIRVRHMPFTTDNIQRVILEA